MSSSQKDENLSVKNYFLHLRKFYDRVVLSQKRKEVFPMKKLKVLLAVLLTMSLLLCGCGGDAEDSADLPEEENVAAAEEEAPEAKTLTMGQVAEGVYSNEYMDVYFAPEGWQLVGADQLQDALADVGTLVEGTELEEKLEGLTQVMDMQAMGPDGVTNVNVVYTKMDAAERIANLAISEEDAMDAILAQLDTLKESYAAAGISINSMEKVPVVYRGEERTGILTLGNAQGIDMAIVQVYERTLGSYSVVITATALQEEDAFAAIEMFESLNQ